MAENKRNEATLRSGGAPEIEVNTGWGEVDLHNFADFVGLELSAANNLEMVWVATPPGNSFFVGRMPARMFRMCFEGVSSFSVGIEDPAEGLGENLGEYYAEDEGGLSRVRFCFDGGTVTIIGWTKLVAEYA